MYGALFVTIMFEASVQVFIEYGGLSRAHTCLKDRDERVHGRADNDTVYKLACFRSGRQD